MTGNVPLLNLGMRQLIGVGFSFLKNNLKHNQVPLPQLQNLETSPIMSTQK